MVAKLIHGIYRKTMIGAISDQLFVSTESVFQKDWLEFHCDDIRAIHVGNGELSDNRRPIKEIHVLIRDGKRTRLLPFLSTMELEWLAFSLNHDLGLQLGEEKLDCKKELPFFKLAEGASVCGTS